MILQKHLTSYFIFRRKIEAEIEAEEHSLKTYFKDNTCSEQREIRQWHEGALNALRRTLRILDGDI